MDKLRVLFVCLGNICRSPLAEGIFKDLVEKAGLSDYIQVDSCGTGAWHVGEAPDTRSQDVANQHGIVLDSYARQLRVSDLATFDYILAMDDQNLQSIMERAGGQATKAQVFKMRHFDALAPEQDVPDPYYGGPQGFLDIYEVLSRSSEKLLAHIRAEHNL